jgi:hypothetical protein
LASSRNHSEPGSNAICKGIYIAENNRYRSIGDVVNAAKNPAKIVSLLSGVGLKWIIIVQYRDE